LEGYQLEIAWLKTGKWKGLMTLFSPAAVTGGGGVRVYNETAAFESFVIYE